MFYKNPTYLNYPYLVDYYIKPYFFIPKKFGALEELLNRITKKSDYPHEKIAVLQFRKKHFDPDPPYPVDKTVKVPSLEYSDKDALDNATAKPQPTNENLCRQIY